MSENPTGYPLSAVPTAAPSLPDTAVSINVRERLIDALAKVRATPIGEFEREIAAAGGDLEIDSKQAEAAIGRLRHELGVALPGPKDVEPEQCNSIGALTALIERVLTKAS